MATERQAEIFRDNVLPNVGEAAANGINLGGNVTGFLAHEGCLYSHDSGLMVVGRAVNGFEHDIEPVAFNRPDFRARYANELWQMSYPHDGNCPMEWVAERFDREGDWSAFWGVIRRVAIGLKVCEPERTDWSSHLTWSNLYKVTPAVERNPNDPLCDAQYEGCKELFKCEFQDYSPRFLLFLTENRNNPEWWARPFLNDLYGHELQCWSEGNKQYVCFTARLSLTDCPRETLIVGVVHPERQPGTRQMIADEILSAFRR